MFMCKYVKGYRLSVKISRTLSPSLTCSLVLSWYHACLNIGELSSAVQLSLLLSPFHQVNQEIHREF